MICIVVQVRLQVLHLAHLRENSSEERRVPGLHALHDSVFVVRFCTLALVCEGITSGKSIYTE